MRCRAIEVFSIVALSLGLEQVANADWIFPAHAAYLRSVSTPEWNVAYETDLWHSFATTWSAYPTVEQNGVGDYWAVFWGLAPGGLQGGGNVQVTSVGSDGTHCKVFFWQSSLGAYYDSVGARVRCFNSQGDPADSIFTMSFTDRVGVLSPGGDFEAGPETAYVWAFDPSSPSYDATNSFYTWNSTGGTTTIEHTPGTGDYNITFAGQNGGVNWALPSIGGCDASKEGTVEVTAYGGGNAFCKALSPPSNDTDAHVHVRCFDGSTGAPAEATFSLVYSTISPNASQSGAYAYAHWSDGSSYYPALNYRQQFVKTGDGNECPHCYPWAAPYVTRYSTGNYVVVFPEVGFDYLTHVDVTAVGYDPNRCKIFEWWGNSSWTSIQILCHTWNGLPIDSEYIVNLSSQEFQPS